MTSGNRIKGVSFLLVLLSVMVSGGTALAGASSIIRDDRGDATPSHMDILQASIDFHTGTQQLIFKMMLAGVVPSQPAENICYVWGLDTDLDETTPGVPSGQPLGAVDFAVRVCFNGSAYVGKVFDRRPLEGGNPPLVVATVPFRIAGPVIEVPVDLSLLDSPLTFQWNAATRLPTPGAPVDRAPDSGRIVWSQ